MARRIRVVQLFYTFDVEVGGGGLSLFAIELGKKLDPDRFEVILCSLGYFGQSAFGQKWIDRLKAQGIHAFEATAWDEDNPYRSFYTAQKRLAADFSKRPVDILHSHSEFTDVTALLLKVQRKAPTIIRTVHYGYAFEWSTKPIRRQLLTNFLYPILFDLEVGINHQNTARLNRRLVARMIGRQAVRIPNAISLERFTDIQVDIQGVKVSLGIPQDAIIIGSVGRLADQKGYRYLIEAAAQVIRHYPNVYFLLIGDGPLIDEHKEHAHQLGISHQFIFTGGRTDVVALLACLDLFVSSSLWEGLPTVTLEAMASEVPVLSTDIPGSNELVQHNRNGWLVPAADSEALSVGMLELIKRPALRKEFAERARDTARQYSIDHIAKEYEAIYERLTR